jgi:hypothetical protein
MTARPGTGHRAWTPRLCGIRGGAIIDRGSAAGRTALTAR